MLQNTEPEDSRTKTFLLRHGVKLVGGFAGDEYSISQRDLELNKTVLNGDIGVPGDDVDNVYHVVIGAHNAEINGFTITGGNSPDHGGGLVNHQKTTNVFHCTFYGNKATLFGAAIGNYQVTGSTISHCTFVENSTVGTGGAISSREGGGELTIVESVFEDNSAGGDGGAVWTVGNDEARGGGTAVFRGNTFQRNISGGSGGAVYRSGSSFSSFYNSAFNENVAAEDGGAIFNNISNKYTSSSIVNCVFENNSAGRYGGGIYGKGTKDSRSSISKYAFANCKFSQNVSKNAGGALLLSTLKLTIINSLFYGNEATNYSGGVHISNSSSTIYQSTFSQNVATAAGGIGGAVLAEEDSSAAIYSSIFWKNSAQDGENIYSVNGAQLHHSLIDGGCDAVNGPTCGNNVIVADPLFVNPETGNFRLQSNSPCINASYNRVLPKDSYDIDGDNDTRESYPNDLDGKPRIADDDRTPPDAVDMGAYEFWSGCGNYEVEVGEGCDDGNLVGGDGCSATCEVE